MKTKYCGIGSKEELQVVANAGCAYIGFVFAASKRRVELSDVISWLHSVEYNQEIVALVVHPTLEDVKALYEAKVFSILQLHGNETVEDVKELRAHFPALKIWKAVHVDEEANKKLHAFAPHVDALLLDTKTSHAWGGTGKTFEWRKIPGFIDVLSPYKKPLLIAGGINRTNVQALLQYDVYGLDLSSGIERNGKKDQHAIEELEEVMEQYENRRLPY
ncbi:phosphoribosylanthranilate isomerase [Shouchella sp. JSM 1781072]|uniref:phosphoribosylanthranilate isomerase n=1 Tax=Bacillaceae TaxID=186817 RepID=UPI000C08640F|nr:MULTISPECIES: phosphoribosylanthranilate isomerase [Bacillaceae]UTR08383.1 phosphoribosylanthranilate isomerase [Alkalihalobacillus sp. LMS6]